MAWLQVFPDGDIFEMDGAIALELHNVGDNIQALRRVLARTRAGTFKIAPPDKPKPTINLVSPETVSPPEAISDNPDIQRAQAIVRLRKECKKQGLSLQQTAYVCATAEHESANTFKAIKEYGTDSYFTEMYEGREDLGNTEPGDGIRFCGRGLVQLTGRNNYTKYSALLGIDLVENPDKVLDEQISQFIIVHGMRTGIFTGMCLDDYINNHACDYMQARRIVNGLDRAEHIAAIARSWEKFITEHPLT